MSRKVPLYTIAHGRSGDKGNKVNIGLIARSAELYPILTREVTCPRVQTHFAELCTGKVERFELPNLWALNFLLHDALDGGGTISLRTDAQGKTYAAMLLRLMIELREGEHVRD